MDNRRGHAVLPLHRLQVPEPRVLPFTIGSFDTFGPHSHAPYPHRHTFHEIVYVTQGRGSHVIDLYRRSLGPPQLCVITPGQVHFWEHTGELQGVVVLFDDDFLLAHPGDRDLLRLLGARSWPHLDDATTARVEELVHGMCREYREQRPGMASVLQAYLHILLVTMSRLPDGEGPQQPRPLEAAGGREPGRTLPHVAPAPAPPAATATSASREGAAALSHRFARSLTGAEGGAARSVRDWAAELGVSAGYLGEAVKRTTGRTPGELIRDSQVLEAKRLLSGTGMTVSRVAREVGFADAAYFCRFFRRETGATPGEFRREARRMHHAHHTESIDRPERAS